MSLLLSLPQRRRRRRRDGRGCPRAGAQVRSKFKEVSLHKSSPLGEMLLECYVSGTRNVFQLGFVPCRTENVVVLLARDPGLNLAALKDLDLDTAQWQPLVQERMLLPWLVKEPSEAEALRARQLTPAQANALEDAWRRDPAATLERVLAAPDAGAEPARVALRYTDAYQYQARARGCAAAARRRVAARAAQGGDSGARMLFCVRHARALARANDAEYLRAPDRAGGGVRPADEGGAVEGPARRAVGRWPQQAPPRLLRRPQGARGEPRRKAATSVMLLVPPTPLPPPRPPARAAGRDGAAAGGGRRAAAAPHKHLGGRARHQVGGHRCRRAPHCRGGGAHF